MAALAACIIGNTLEAQVRPDKNWRTIQSEHFYVHFAPELEDIARRAAAQAETAYVQLSAHLKPPRGKIDLLLTDDVDYSNGFATPNPTNRIVIYANPPVTESALRYTDDFLQLVVTHELVHIFHLDRVGGVWALLQKVFGRVPMLFVNGYQPRWITEGLAVYYESLLTGSGRVLGSEHRMLARSAALEHRFPRIDELSYVYPRFPYGTASYAYGSLFVDYLADTHGDSSVATYIERSSRRLFPWDLDGASRRAFGTALPTQYRRWASALRAELPPARPPMPGWENLTVDGVYASFPRWLNDTTLIYTGTPGDESYGAYRLVLHSSALGPASRVTRERIARRHTASPSTPLPDGSLLYSELEYTDPFTIRSDLYVDDVRRGKRRLTRGARLAAPDARLDGLIVAMQTVPAGTRLALVSRDGRTITPITTGSIDEQWAEPRWSPDGRHIAAIRWTRGGTSSVVVVDTTGRIVRTLVSERTVNATPSWSAAGDYVYFSSDRSGITNLYRARFSMEDANPSLELMSSASTGLFQPQPSPSGDVMAAVVFKADGYHIGLAPLDQVQLSTAPAIPTVVPRTADAVARHGAPATRYSALRMLWPRGWLPFFDAGLDSGSYRFGALVSGRDIAERHAYEALLYVPTDASGLTGSFTYRNAMFGRPLIDLGYAQEWDNIGCVADASQQNRCVGDLRRRIRDVALAFTFQRPRIRTFSFAGIGTGIEIRDYATDSASLIGRIDSLYQRTYYYPRLVLSAGWSNVQFPPAAISPEDGFSVSATSRHRWRTGDFSGVSPDGTQDEGRSRMTSSIIGSVSAFKSLDFPGYAHHVVALNVAGGIEDNRSPSYFEVGGVSGSVLEIFPGYVLGEGRRTFGIRGFDPAAQIGIYAFKASAEYRAPLLMPGRGIETLPLFFDRTSVTLFGEAGSAWCPAIFVARPAPLFSRCTSLEADLGIFSIEPELLASAGAEVAVSAAILSWDVPYRFRLGAAVPLAGKDAAFGNTKPRVYFAIGASF